MMTMSYCIVAIAFVLSEKLSTMNVYFLKGQCNKIFERRFFFINQPLLGTVSRKSGGVMGMRC
jgi:hypothetical protein